MANLTGEKLKSLNDKLNEWRTICLEETQDWLNVYRDGLNYTFGNQLAGKKLKDGWDPIIANYIFPAVMQDLSILSQRQTSIIARPTEDRDSPDAKMWKAHLQWLYEEELNMDEFLLRAALDGKIAGFYVAKTIWEPTPFGGWDEEKKRWLGKVRCNLVHPSYFGADPEPETGNLDDAAYIFTARRERKENVKRRWSGFDDEIDAAANEDDAWDSSSKGLYDTIVLDNKPDLEPQDTSHARIVNLLRGRQRPRLNEEGKEAQYVTIEEFHFRDYEEEGGKKPGEQISEEDLIRKGLAWRDENILRSGETGQMLGPENWPRKDGLQYKEPLYPRGRMILRVGEKTILNPDTNDQKYPYHRRPFVVGVNHLLPHSWRGLNGVEMGIGLQDWVNIGIQHLGNYVKYFGDPQVEVEEGALAGASTPKKIAQWVKSQAGKIIVLKQGKLDKIRRVAPPGLGTGVPAVFQMMAQELRDQTGAQDVSLGRKSKGDETATELVRRDTNAKLRTALSHKLFDEFTVRLWRNIAELVQRNYEDDRILRVIGEEHAPTLVQYTQGMKDLRFDVKLEVTTKLPFDIERKRTNLGEAIQVLGPVPSLVKRWLEASEISNPDEILEELPIFQQFMAFMEQQQAAQGAAPQ